MTIETTGDLVRFVLRASGINGVGQTPLPEDVNTCLDFLRMLIAQWQRKRWLIWHEQEVAKISTGSQWYTIGSGEDFDTARPDKIHAAWVRLKPFNNPGAMLTETTMPFSLAAQPTRNSVDISLRIIEAMEDWSTIAIKDLKSIPSAVFYDSQFPVGRVTFWPVPPANDYELHLIIKGGLPVYETLVDPLNLPDEYIEALVWSLCVRMQMAYGLPARLDHAAAMKQAVNVVSMANVQIALLSLPRILGGRGGDVSSWAGKGLNQAWTVGGECELT